MSNHINLGSFRCGSTWFLIEFGNFIAQTCLPKALAWLDHSIRLLTLSKNTLSKGMDLLIDAVLIIRSLNEYWAYSDWPMTSQTKQSIKILASSKWLHLEKWGGADITLTASSFTKKMSVILFIPLNLQVEEALWNWGERNMCRAQSSGLSVGQVNRCLVEN